jgi:integrase
MPFSGPHTAMKDQVVIRNAAALVKPPRVVEKEVEPLTPDEARQFLKSIKGHRLEGLFTVAVSLGLRQGEALGLRWKDVDFDTGTLRIRFALQRLKTHENDVTKSAFHLVEPKTKQSRRTISMPAVTLSALAFTPRSIQAALGWENLSMLNRYSHFVQEQRQAVANAMESILNPVAVKVAVSSTGEKPN